MLALSVANSVSEEVGAGLSGGLGVVALESTLVAHGLPWPDNLETALAMEAAVREVGGVPATTALFDGRPRVGLARSELEALARRPEAFPKAGVRDLPLLAAQGKGAATTVGSTLFLAHQAGIEVVATGGIGGVHREAAETADVSSDLLELSKTPVVVVCSGAKSILDLPRTMEVLETLSVPVVGYGVDEFPAFYSRQSGIFLDHRVDEPDQAAAVYHASRQLRLSSGLLVANPPPLECSVEFKEMEGWISDSLRHAKRAGISGKAVTPFLLERIRELSGGRSLKVNQALAVSNARLAARIAAALSS